MVVPGGLLALPQEILLNLVKLLEDEDVFNCAATCRSWRKAFLSPEVYEALCTTQGKGLTLPLKDEEANVQQALRTVEARQKVLKIDKRIMQRMDIKAELDRLLADSDGWLSCIRQPLHNGDGSELTNDRDQINSAENDELLNTHYRWACGTIRPAAKSSWHDFYRDLQRFSREFGSEVVVSRYIAYAISASTTDMEYGGETQTLGETLKPGSMTFWSSEGSEDEDSSEQLMYGIQSGVALIRRVCVRPYRADYQFGMPTYAPKYIRISVSMEPDSHYTFVSEPISIRNEDQLQAYELPPTVVLGRYIRIDLYGRWTRQQFDNKFYTVIKDVRIDGMRACALESLGLHHLSKAVAERAGADVELEKNKRRLPTSLEDLPKKTEAINLTPREDLMRVQKWIAQGKFTEAAALVAEHPVGSPVRSKTTLDLFQKATEEFVLSKQAAQQESDVTAASRGSATSNGSTSRRSRSGLLSFSSHAGSGKTPMRILLIHLSRGRLSEEETLELAKESVHSNDPDLLHHCLSTGKALSSAELGDIMRQSKPETALWIYTQAHCIDRIMDCLIELGRVQSLVTFLSHQTALRDINDEVRMIITSLRDRGQVNNAYTFSLMVLENVDGVDPTVVLNALDMSPDEYDPSSVDRRLDELRRIILRSNLAHRVDDDGLDMIINRILRD
eukprot:Clim_evm32s149 gene=Clim_evmTU32s149